MYNECCKWKASLLQYQNQHWLQLKSCGSFPSLSDHWFNFGIWNSHFKIALLNYLIFLQDFWFTDELFFAQKSQKIYPVSASDKTFLLSCIKVYSCPILTFSFSTFTFLPFHFFLFKKNNSSTHNKYIDPTMQLLFSRLVLQQCSHIGGGCFCFTSMST